MPEPSGFFSVFLMKFTISGKTILYVTEFSYGVYSGPYLDTFHAVC